MRLLLLISLFILNTACCTCQVQIFLAHDTPPAAGSSIQGWLDEISTQGGTAPSATEQGYLVTLKDSLDSSGLIDSLDAMYIVAQDGSEIAAFVNFINPDNYLCTETGSMTWTSDVGWTSSTSTSNYINTNFDPALENVNYQGQDALYGVAWAGFGGLGLNQTTEIFGATGATYDNRFRLVATISQDQYNYYNNRSTAITHPVGAGTRDTITIMMVSIQSSTNTELFLDGSSADTAGSNAEGNPDVDIYIGAVNNNDTGVTVGSEGESIHMVWFGKGLTDANVSKLNGYIKTYLEAIGL